MTAFLRRSGVHIGMSAPPGVAGVKLLETLKLGDCVLTRLPADPAEALAVARYCRERRIGLFFSELLYRGTRALCLAFGRRIPRRAFYSRAELEAIAAAAGDYYGGRMVLGEAGGVLYWPKTYVVRRGVDLWDSLPSVRGAGAAQAQYLRYLRRFLAYERTLGGRPFLNVESSLLFKYHAAAGIDAFCLELMPGDPHRMTAAIRGAARAFRKPWGAHLACEYYGGVRLDGLWLKRWKISLYFSYLGGAQFIWPESGHLGYTTQPSGTRYGFRHPRVRAVRRILRETRRFVGLHGRPASGPRVALGVIHGLQDGTPGLWNPRAWGQVRGRAWRAGPAERGWELLDGFFRREPWSNPYVQGADDFSGQPPFGQVDIVPAEAHLGALRRYRCLLFLGWNTMTPVLYAKLKTYVSGGGHLLLFLPQLGTQTGRTDPLRLFRGGRVADLFGVTVTGWKRTDVYGAKCCAASRLPGYRFPLWRARTDPRFLGEWTPAAVRLEGARVISGYDDGHDATREDLEGRPLLVEHALGRGTAFLVLVREYPASGGLRPFARDVLRTVLAGEQGAIRVQAPDRLRYAVYDEGRGAARREVIYLLNTDPDVAAPVRVWVRGSATAPFLVPPAELRVAYRLGPLVVAPADKNVRLRATHVEARRVRLAFYAVADQEALVFNLSKRPVSAEIGCARRAIPPGGQAAVRVPRAVERRRAAFYRPDYLDEPAVAVPDTTTPY